MPDCKNWQLKLDLIILSFHYYYKYTFTSTTRNGASKLADDDVTCGIDNEGGNEGDQDNLM